MPDTLFSEIHFVTPLRGEDAFNMLVKFVPKKLADKLREQWRRIGSIGHNQMAPLGDMDDLTWYLGLDGSEGFFCLTVMRAHSSSKKGGMTIAEVAAVEKAALEKAGSFSKGWMWVRPSYCNDDDVMRRVYANIKAKRHWSHGL